MPIARYRLRSHQIRNIPPQRIRSVSAVLAAVWFPPVRPPLPRISTSPPQARTSSRPLVIHGWSEGTATPRGRGTHGHGALPAPPPGSHRERPRAWTDPANHRPMPSDALVSVPGTVGVCRGRQRTRDGAWVTSDKGGRSGATPARPGRAVQRAKDRLTIPSALTSAAGPRRFEPRWRPPSSGRPGPQAACRE
jgi:hypothetical protein